MRISVVINTLNEEPNIKKAIESVTWADEILVCDMYSEDKTVEIAKKLGAKIIFHERVGFVEPARNFAISQASGNWILILDADEEVSITLKDKLLEIVNLEADINFVKVPRKNIIFNKWMKASMWWPDYNVRFFKKGAVKWGDAIHRPPKTTGEGISLEEKEDYALIHYHYTSVSQFINRMNRYTDIQSQELINSGYIFEWKDIIKKPLNEFLGRYFASKGFEDGLHGLALSLLQSFSFLVMYLKIWEQEKFTEKQVSIEDVEKISKESGKEISYWFKYGNLPKNLLKRLLKKAKNKFI